MILGLEKLTVDYFVGEEKPWLDLRRDSGRVVTFHAVGEFDQLRPVIQRTRNLRISAGGNVGNALVAAARTRRRRGHLDSKVQWIGPAARDRDSLDALRSTASSGVIARPHFVANGTTRALVFGGGDTAGHGDHSIAVFEGSIPANVLQPSDLAAASRVIVALDLLTRNGMQIANRIIDGAANIDLLLNHLIVSGEALGLLAAAIQSFRIRNIFGRRDEMAELARSLGTCLDRWPERFRTALWITNGNQPVRLIAPDARLNKEYSVQATITPPPRSTVGAGDVFAGTAIALLDLGVGYDCAVLGGLGAAAQSLSWHEARATTREQCVTLLRGTPLEPHCSELIELRESINETSGAVVISGGQTGVDTIALAAAVNLGVPALAILPKGRRNECTDGVPGVDKSSLPREANIIELESERYRVRTWATAFCADATVLIGDPRTPGSSETIAACEALGRPYFLVGATSSSNFELRRFLKAVPGRILNIAGNRASLLRPELTRSLPEFLDRIIYGYAQELANQTPISCATADYGAAQVSSCNAQKVHGRAQHGDHRLSVAIVKSSALVRIGQLLSPTMGHRLAQLAEWDYKSSLEWSGGALYSGRGSDVCSWLADGHVDCALVGLDDLLEYFPAAVRLWDFGIMNSSICLLSLDRQPLASGAMASIVSQIPKTASRLLQHHGIEAAVNGVAGSAENWLLLGAASKAIDTLHSGKALRLNKMRVELRLASTSLVLAVRRDCPPRLRSLCRRWLQYASQRIL